MRVIVALSLLLASCQAFLGPFRTSISQNPLFATRQQIINGGVNGQVRILDRPDIRVNGGTRTDEKQLKEQLEYVYKFTSDKDQEGIKAFLPVIVQRIIQALRSGNLSRTSKLLSSIETNGLAGKDMEWLVEEIREIAAAASKLAVEASMKENSGKNQEKAINLLISQVGRIENRLAQLEKSGSQLDGKTLSSIKDLMKKVNEENASLKDQVMELSDFDTVSVSWRVDNFESQLNQDSMAGKPTILFSSPIYVAGYKMNLQLEILPAKDNNSKRSVGLYLCHCEDVDGHNTVPIYIGGTSMTLKGKNDDIKKIFEDRDVIKERGQGWGWKDFTSIDHLRKNCVDKGGLNIGASIRVKRVDQFKL
jgi:hypothetical protein